MSNEAFKRNFSKLLKRVGDRANDVVRKTALELQTGMVESSPVDSGRFKGNWQCGVGAIDSTQSGKMDTTPLGDHDKSGSTARTDGVLIGWKPGKTIYLTNALPYSRRLEHGWSKQAPSGVVRLTVQNYSRALAEAVKGLK